MSSAIVSPLTGVAVNDQRTLVALSLLGELGEIDSIVLSHGY